MPRRMLEQSRQFMEQSDWLPPHPTSIAQARRFVEKACSGLSEDALNALRLLVSELATNAVEHAQSRFVVRLGVEESGRAARLEVIDRGPGEPTVLHRSPDESGRGLRIVERLASDWGWAERLGGKVVWCNVDLSG